jgi:hypothetical protein
LTREEADRILRASSAFQQASYFRVGRTEQAAVDPGGCFQFQNKPGWRQLTDLGYAMIDLKISAQPTAFSEAWYGCTLQLTAEGQQQASRWRAWSGPFDSSGWEIPIATVQFVGVTGISMVDGADTGQVEFAYRWAATDFAQRLGRIPDGGQRAGAAVFRRYDDGWRLQEFGFGAVTEPNVSDAAPTGQVASDWAAYMINQDAATAVTFNLSADNGSTWQTFSLAPRTLSTYHRMNRFKCITSYPDGHTHSVEYALPAHGLKYYSISARREDGAWNLWGDDELIALANQANRGQ